MRKYKRYIKKYLVYFTLGPLIVTLEACGEFILPYINANIIDIGAAQKDICLLYTSPSPRDRG